MHCGADGGQQALVNQRSWWLSCCAWLKPSPTFSRRWPAPAACIATASKLTRYEGSERAHWLDTYNASSTARSTFGRLAGSCGVLSGGRAASRQSSGVTGRPACDAASRRGRRTMALVVGSGEPACGMRQTALKSNGSAMGGCGSLVEDRRSGQTCPLRRLPPFGLQRIRSLSLSKGDQRGRRPSGSHGDGARGRRGKAGNVVYYLPVGLYSTRPDTQNAAWLFRSRQTKTVSCLL